MALKGKIEAKVEIKSSAKEYHDILNGKPHHLANISADKVRSCDLHSGDLGSSGSTLKWHYNHEGEERFNKCIIEVDDGKYMVRYKVIEGHFTEKYTDSRCTYYAIPKPEGEGTIIHWVLEYEKLDESTPDPTSFLEFLCDITKDVDAHLQEEAAAAAAAAN